jgi:hypothetical protein
MSDIIIRDPAIVELTINDVDDPAAAGVVLNITDALSLNDTVSLEAGELIQSHHALYVFFSSTPKVYTLKNINAHKQYVHLFCGVSLNSAAQGEIVKFKNLGVIEDSSFNYSASSGLYIAADGRMTGVNTDPAAAGFSFQIGMVLTDKKVFINPKVPILK